MCACVCPRTPSFALFERGCHVERAYIPRLYKRAPREKTSSSPGSKRVKSFSSPNLRKLSPRLVFLGSFLFREDENLHSVPQSCIRSLLEMISLSTNEPVKAVAHAHLSLCPRRRRFLSCRRSPYYGPLGARGCAPWRESRQLTRGCLPASSCACQCMLFAEQH